jgi:aminopeptidase N
LRNYNKPEYKNLYVKWLSDSSYSVAGEALGSLTAVDSVMGYKEAQRLSKQPAKGTLGDEISETMIKFGDESAFEVIAPIFDDMPLSTAKFDKLQPFASFLVKVKDPVKFKAGVDMIVNFRDAIPASFRAQTDPFINGSVLKGLVDKKEKNGEKELADYVKGKLAGQKGF